MDCTLKPLLLDYILYTWSTQICNRSVDHSMFFIFATGNKSYIIWGSESSHLPVSPSVVFSNKDSNSVTERYWVMTYCANISAGFPTVPLVCKIHRSWDSLMPSCLPLLLQILVYYCEWIMSKILSLIPTYCEIRL